MNPTDTLRPRGNYRTCPVSLVALLLALVVTGTAQATRPKDALDFGGERNELVFNLAVSPDGKFLAVYRGRALMLWDVATKKLVSTVKPDGWWVTSDFAFSPDGKSLMVGAYRSKGEDAWDNALVVWDLATVKESRRIDLEDVPRGYMIFAPDGKWLVVGTADPSVVVYDLQSGKKAKTLACENERKGRVSALAVSPDGKTLAAAVTGAVLLFDLGKGELLRTIEAPKELKQQMANYNSTLHVGGSPSLHELMQVSRLFEDWPDRVGALALSPDGKRLISVDSNRPMLC